MCGCGEEGEKGRRWGRVVSEVEEMAYRPCEVAENGWDWR